MSGSESAAYQVSDGQSSEPTEAAGRDRYESLQEGDLVVCWPGFREGPGLLATVVYEGVRSVGGSDCLYVRPIDSHGQAIALTHLEVVAS